MVNSTAYQALWVNHIWNHNGEQTLTRQRPAHNWQDAREIALAWCEELEEKGYKLSGRKGPYGSGSTRGYFSRLIRNLDDFVDIAIFSNDDPQNAHYIGFTRNEESNVVRVAKAMGMAYCHVTFLGLMYKSGKMAILQSDPREWFQTTRGRMPLYNIAAGETIVFEPSLFAGIDIMEADDDSWVRTTVHNKEDVVYIGFSLPNGKVRIRNG